MNEKKVRVKIKTVVTDLSAILVAQKMLDEEIAEGDNDEIIEYTTDGIIKLVDDEMQLCYDESSDMGMDNSTTTLIFRDADRTTLDMVRTGDASAGLCFSSVNRRQNCAYNVAGMMLDFCIVTRKLTNSVTLDGGEIYVDYLIEVRGTNTQRNRISISIVPKKED